MKKFIDDTLAQNLISLLKSYEQNNGSLFHSNQFDVLIKTLFEDFLQLDEFYQGTKLVRDKENSKLYIDFNKEINALNKNNILLNNEYEKSKEGQIKAYANQLNEEKKLVDENHKKDLNEFEPIKESLKKEIKNNNLKTANDIKIAGHDLNKLINQIGKNIDIADKKSLDKINAKLSLIEKNNAENDSLILKENKESNKKNKNIYSDNEKIKQELLNEIEINKSEIAANTAKTNDFITALYNNTAEISNQKVVPYQEKLDSINDEEKQNGQIYKEISSLILNEFTNKLKEVDEQISKLREAERLYDEQYKQGLIDHKIEFEKEADKQLQVYDSQIANIKKFMRYDSPEEQAKKQKILNKLTTTRVNLNKKLQKQLADEQVKLTKKYIADKLDFIKKLEELRTDKTIYEAIKNNAFKNINLEQSTNMNKDSILKKLYTSLLANNRFIDQYKENIKALSVRYNTDNDNNILNHTINVKKNKIKKYDFVQEASLKEQEVYHQKELEKISALRNYNKNLILEDIDLEKVTRLLLNQQQDITINYYRDVYNEKIRYININQEFLTKTTNIQHELNKLEENLYNDKYNRYLVYLDERKTVFKNHIDLIQKYDVDANEIERSKNESDIRVKLYGNRFNVEESIIADAYYLVNQKMIKIINFENIVLTNFTSSSEDIFINAKDDIKEIISTLKIHKQDVINEYKKNVRQVIEGRINFLKTIKYQKILEEMDNNYQRNNAELNERIKRLEETINNYKSTIEIFKNENIELIDKNQQLLSERKINEMQIEDNLNLIKKNNEKIIMNRKSIKDLTKSLIRLKSNLVLAEKKYNTQKNIIMLKTKEDAKMYDLYLAKLDKANIDLLKDSNKNEKLLSTLKTYKSLPRVINKAMYNNTALITKIKNYYKMFNKFLSDIIYDELEGLRKNYTITYNQASHNNIFQIEEEKNNYQATLKKLQNDYESDLQILDVKYSHDKGVLLKELKHETNLVVNQRRNNMQNLAKLEKEYNYNLQCANLNIENYEHDHKKKKEILALDYTNELTNIEADCKIKISRIKKEIYNYETHYKNQNDMLQLEKTNLDKDNYNRYQEDIKNFKQKIRQLSQNNKVQSMEESIIEKQMFKHLSESLLNNRKDLDKTVKGIKKSLNIKVKENQKNFIKNFNNKQK